MKELISLMRKASDLINTFCDPHELRVTVNEREIEIAKLTVNQHGELIEWSVERVELDRKGLPKSEYRYWINCWGSSWLGMGNCLCNNHDPDDSYGWDLSHEPLHFKLHILGNMAIDVAELLNQVARLDLKLQYCGDDQIVGYYDFEHLKNVLKAVIRRAEQKLKERQRDHDEIVEETYIENQYGEKVLERQVIALADGRKKVIQLNCYSSYDLGLGTCMCQSHEPYKVYYIT